MPFDPYNDDYFEQVIKGPTGVKGVGGCPAGATGPEVMLRHNSGKPPLSYLPTSLIDAVRRDEDGVFPTLLLDDTAQVLAFGAKKYSPNNWRKSGSWLAVTDCALRHFHKMFRGETYDDESGIHHAAHILCNLGFLTEFIYEGDGTDDRYIVKRPLVVDEVDESSLLLAYDSLLEWKDGRDHTFLYQSIQILAEWYEEIKP